MGFAILVLDIAIYFTVRVSYGGHIKVCFNI